MVSSGVLLNGRYRLEERIASGGMGDVWKGTIEQLILLPPEAERGPLTPPERKAESDSPAMPNQPAVGPN